MSNGMLKGDAETPARPILKMDGTAVLFHAVQEVPGNIRALLERNGKKVDDVDMFLLHQASKRVVDLIRTKLEVPIAKVPFEVAEYGNTISSSIPILLKSCLIAKEAKRIVLSGFGVGFTWGSCLVEFQS